MHKFYRVLITVITIIVGYFIVNTFIQNISFVTFLFIEVIVTCMHIFENSVYKYFKTWH